MKTSLLPRLSLALMLLALPAGAATTPAAGVLGRAPMAFEPNLGQSDPQVRYLARGAGYALFLTRDEAVLALSSGASPATAEPGGTQARPNQLRQSVLRLRTVGGQAPEALEAEEALPGRSHYARASEPGKALRDVPRYGRVRARGVYPGIDLVYYGNGEHLEYDFVVAPGADPGRIRLGFEGARSLALDDGGNLRLRLATGELVQPAPVLYQEDGGVRRPVAGRFVLAGGTVGFEVGAYDPTRALVIDPTLAWASLLGGSSTEWALDVAVTPNGQAYACGYTASTNFPTRPTATDPSPADVDAYVTKFNLDGSGIDWSTYVGGPGYQTANAISLDANRNSYVTGRTDELDADGDAWIFQVDAAGNVQWSQIFGGSSSDGGQEIYVDSALNSYVVGSTFSSDFRGPNPNPNVPQAGYGGGQDAFVAKLNRFGTLLYTTFYGGAADESGSAIGLDASGRIVFTGTVTSFPPPSYNAVVDVFAVRLNATTTGFQGQLTLGGSNDDYAGGLAVDPSGNVWLAGTTYSSDFPTTTATAFRNTLSGVTDAFLVRLASSWTVAYATYLGNADKQVVVGLLADDIGRLYPVGQVTQPGPSGLYDLWAARFTPASNSVSYLTFPATGNDYTSGCAMDASRWIYIAGVTTSTDLATPGAFQTNLKGPFDGFVAKVSF